MFRIECYCEDKKLHLVLTALEGLIHPNPLVQRVADVNVSNGKISGVAGEADLADLFYAHVRKHKLTEVRAKDARDFLKANGFSPDSSSYCMRHAVKRGYFRRVGQSNATRYITKTAKA